VFGPFQGCTDGASYGIVADKRTGSGTTCLLTAPDFSPCSEGIGFCRDLATHTVLSLGQKGTVELDANQHEAVTSFDPFSVETTWTGTVTAGTRSFHRFVGADVGGGGLTSFDANGTQTGQLEFVIGEPRKQGLIHRGLWQGAGEACLAPTGSRRTCRGDTRVAREGVARGHRRRARQASPLRGRGGRVGATLVSPEKALREATAGGRGKPRPYGVEADV
jgi:hypothetical protein